MAVLVGLMLLVETQITDLDKPLIPTSTTSAAAEAGVDPVDLQGAVNSTGLAPRVYLRSVGELDSPVPAPPVLVRVPAIEQRLDCIQRYESGGYAGAYNRSSGASGPFQFLGATWRSTPQGRAGMSVFDPVAAREAARWMLSQGRAREWVPVQQGRC